MTIWCPVMFRDELDMLQMRLEETSGWAITVLAEAGVTHRGVRKPLYFAENEPRFDGWSEAGRLFYECASLPDDPNPWVREHAQRNAAWWIIDSMAEDADWVIIGDLDEIPCKFWGREDSDVWAVRMRTFLYAVDWEAADQDALPPTCVYARVSYIREHDGDLAGIRDRRADYPVVPYGGFHFSWLGGPEAQARKLDASCHKEEIEAGPGAERIRSGEAWRDGASTGIPVKHVVPDNTFPAFILGRRCPGSWFRP